MAPIDMKALLEAGVHFGHRTQKWDPRMKPYIFTERNGIHIIDLQQTVKALEEAYKLVREAVADGKTVMFVGTKRQAVETIEAEAQRAGMPYVTVRWLGGMLTNWSTMRQRISELETLERMAAQAPAEGESSKLKLTKREMLTNSRKAEKLQERFGGIRNMNRVPDLLFVVDVNREETAVREANILGIPVVGLVDTNCNPSVIDYVIPSNDDAIRAIKLMVSYMADAALEGRSLRQDKQEVETAKVETKTAAPRRRTEDGPVQELTDEALLGQATLAKVAEEQAKEAQKAETTEAKPAAAPKKPAGAPAAKTRKPKLKKSDLQGTGEEEASE